MATKLVNGKRVDLTAQEAAQIRAAQSGMKAQSEARRVEAENRRDAALARLATAGVDIADVRYALKS